jgi:DNA polymerase-3 subunit chi
MNAACQVAFYVLSNAERSPAHLACHLALKAWEQGHCVMVFAANENEANALDEVMWELPVGRFLPHSKNAPDSDTPVSIGLHGTAIPDGRDVLINLSDQPIADARQLQRLLEIVPGTEEQRLASRQKFRVYRDMGLETTTHHL